MACRQENGLYQCVSDWLSTGEIQRYLNVNRHKGVLWYNKEAFEEFVWWMTANAVLSAISQPDFSASSFVELVLKLNADVDALFSAKERSKYQVTLLLEALKK